MNLYLLADKLHTDNTIAAARAYHHVNGLPIVLTDDPSFAIGVVLKHNETGEFLAGRARHGLLLSLAMAPRFYRTADNALIAVGNSPWSAGDFSLMYVHEKNCAAITAHAP